MPCPGLGSHPLTTGIGHLCQQLPSALIRVTKWSQTQGPLCPLASCAHTTPQQCQPRHTAQGRRLPQPGCLPWGSAGVRRHPQSQKEPRFLHGCGSKLQPVGFQGRKELSQLMEPLQAAGQEGD